MAVPAATFAAGPGSPQVITAIMTNEIAGHDPHVAPSTLMFARICDESARLQRCFLEGARATPFPAPRIRTKGASPTSAGANGWGPAVVARSLAHHQLGDYDGEPAAAQALLRREPDNRFYMQMEVKALAGLGRAREVEQRCTRSLTLNPSGWNQWQPCGQAIDELQAHGLGSEAILLAQRLSQSFQSDTTRTPPQRALDAADALATVSAWDSAARVLRPLPSRDPDFLAYLERLGEVQSWRGDRDALAQTEQRIAEVSGGSVPLMTLARFAALVGERDRAVDLLAQHFREGGSGRYFLHEVSAFASLRGYPPFEALSRPIDDPDHLRAVLPNR